MAILFCSKCTHLREVKHEYIGRSVKCPNCTQVTSIHDTVNFINMVFDKYRLQQKLLQELQALNNDVDKPAMPTSDIQKTLQTMDINNTSTLTETAQYQPILDWFQQRHIQLEVNLKAIDTTGFFDEIALQLGNQYDILGEVNKKIKFVQSRNYSDVKLILAKKSQKEIHTITQFCQSLHDYSFVGKYFYQKKEKIVRLKLQDSSNIKHFFNGEWMEWFVFMKLLAFCQKKGLPYSGLRNLNIQFSNEDRHELDVFFLINNDIAICIECKSGEFRHDIKKYSTLRKRLKLDEQHFFLCVIGLSEQQTQGMSSMYDLTFVNENNFISVIENMLKISVIENMLKKKTLFQSLKKRFLK